MPRKRPQVLGVDLNRSESRVQFPNLCLPQADGAQRSSTRCRVSQFSIHARALRPVNVNALTHWQADHAILFYC
jgi:hypothetical protein